MQISLKLREVFFMILITVGLSKGVEVNSLSVLKDSFLYELSVATLGAVDKDQRFNLLKISTVIRQSVPPCTINLQMANKSR